jgi:hypothetical protein
MKQLFPKGDIYYSNPAVRNGDYNITSTIMVIDYPQAILWAIASWTWDVTHERALSPADLFGGKAPVGALIGLLERIR